MSLLWRDEVSIYVTPAKIALARRARGLKGAVVASTDILIEPAATDGRSAFERLAVALDERVWQDAAARVVVADAWARFAIVPPAAANLDEEARRAQARFVLADTFGEALSDWTLALEEGPPGRAGVVAAMPAWLSPALDAALGPARLRLVSLQPHLISAFNTWRRRLPAEDSWFVALEDGWLAAAHIESGAWDRVHMARMAPDSAIELERIQALARLTRTTLGGRLFVAAHPALRERFQRPGSDLEWLDAGFSA